MDTESEQHSQLFNTDANDPDSIMGQGIIVEEHFGIYKSSASLALMNTAGKVRCKKRTSMALRASLPRNASERKGSADTNGVVNQSESD